MFRIKNVRGSTVAKNSNFLPSLQTNKPLIVPSNKDKEKPLRKEESLPLNKSSKPVPTKVLQQRKPEHHPNIRPPSRKTPAKPPTSFKNTDLTGIDIETFKKHPHKLDIHAQEIVPPKVNMSMIQKKFKRAQQTELNKLQVNKGEKNETKQNNQPQPQIFEELTSPQSQNHLAAVKQQQEALNFLIQKQKEHQQRIVKEQKQKQKNSQAEKQAEKQRQQKAKKKQKQTQQRERKEKQAQEQIERIKKRREDRQRERSRRKQLEEQRQKKKHQFLGQLGGEGLGGMMYTNDPLAHFEIPDILMDAQIHKILKTSFAYFPSGSSIEAKKGELERINMSYEMIRDDPGNQRMAEGLKNFRIQLLNQIGELIMEDQNNGFNHPDFSFIEGDSRTGQVNKDVNITRGIPKLKVTAFMQKYKCQEDEDCPICLQPIGMGSIGSKLKCGHIFHQHCAEDWLQLNANCPSCRKNIKFDT